MKKILSLALVLFAAFGLTSCGDKKTTTTEQNVTKPTDEEIYNIVLKDYEALIEAAKNEKDPDKRYALYAKAEAYLLDQALFAPTTTQGGNYAITRIAPKTVPYVMWGVNSDMLGKMVITNELITKADRDAMTALWQAARKGGDAYDPAAYLTGKGYTLNDTYNSTFTATPQTLDGLDTSRSEDSEHFCNFVDGLVQYDNLGRMQAALAEEVDGKLYTISEDGLTYTFTIRDDANWVTAEGEVYAQVTAQDFVDGFQHMLDASAGLEYLVDGVVAGASEYIKGDTTDMADVGMKADGQTLTITLCEERPYFPTMLTYNIFYPMNAKFFESKGGAFGKTEFAEAKAGENYSYGINSDPASILYNGAFILDEITDQAVIKYVANEDYYDADKITCKKVNYLYDDGSNPTQAFEDTLDGKYTASGLSTALIALAKERKLDGDTENIFDTYSYTADTDSTTYFAGLNLYRRTFKLENGNVASNQTDAQKQATFDAMQIKEFRQALLFAFDRKSWNGSIYGEELATNNLRNMYTAPEFLSTTDGKTYGELVQAELVKLGSHINVADGVDGWYNVEAAQEKLLAAVAAAPDTFKEVIQIDMFYYGASKNQTAQAAAFKKSIEEALTIDGKQYVQVNMISCSTTDDYYNSGYYVEIGEDANYDVYYGSGWGPDFGDPITYLDTFLPTGYMIHVCGLY